MDLLRGPADRQRPARPPPRVGPRVQGPVPPLPDHAGPATCPARAAGTATACRWSSRSRRSSVSPRSTRSRPTASPSSTSAAAIGAALRGGLGGAHRRAPGVWIDTKDAYWTLTNDYVESVWWLVRQMWDKGLLYEGHRVVALLRPLRHRAVVARDGSPGLPATSSTRRSTCASRSPTASRRTPICSCGPPRRGR